MPAFFFVTGFCANFKKPFKKFIQDDLSTLILPSLLFSDKVAWFCMALFTAKIIYYKISNKYGKYYILLLVSVIFSVIGTLMRNVSVEILQIWHATSLFPFILLGQYVRNNSCNAKT